MVLEVLFDPPRHVRLPSGDDELVDRALAVQPLAGRRSSLLTFDTHQVTRARHADLPVIKLAQPDGDEPQQNTKRRKSDTRVAAPSGT